jgi:pyruvate/2-oxoacid:ferredoxin oxidoreductase alpha subunit
MAEQNNKTNQQEVKLMKGNEAIAHAAIRCGADGYFGYPITPQSEVLETLAVLKPWETTQRRKTSGVMCRTMQTC